MQPLSRRALVASGISAAGSVNAYAKDPPRLFDGTPLAGNKVARMFNPVPKGLAFPDVALLGADGMRRPSAFRGPGIVSLWAEWCVPCLAEAPELAALGQRFAAQNVHIISVLTKSRKNLDYRGGREVLDHAKAQALPLFVEPGGGKTVAEAVAIHPVLKQVAVPCNLLINSKGRIVGRSFGAAEAAGPVDIKPAGSNGLTHAQLATALAHGTLWSTPQAVAFVDAIANGALDRLKA